MTARLSEVRTGMITRAVRDSNIGDAVIHEGDFMGITKSKHEGVICEADFRACFHKLLKSLISEDTEIATLYYGEGMTEDDCA